MSAKAEKTFNKLVGIETKVGRPSKTDTEKKALGRYSLNVIQSAIRGNLARKAENKARLEKKVTQPKKSVPAAPFFNPQKFAEAEAKAKILAAVKAKKARLETLKLQKKKIQELIDEFQDDYDISKHKYEYELESNERTGYIDPYIEGQAYENAAVMAWLEKKQKGKKLFVLKNNAYGKKIRKEANKYEHYGWN